MMPMTSATAVALVVLSVAPLPTAMLVTVPAFVPVPAAMIIMVIAIPMPLMTGWRPTPPLRRSIAQKVGRAAARVVAAAVTAPVARMAGRHPHVNGLRLLYHRSTPHGLPIEQCWRCGVTDIDLAIDARGQLSRDGTADIGLSLGKAYSTGQCQCS